MTIYGADTSHHNALGDFPAMRRSGLCDFLFAKATEGVGWADPQYEASRAGAKAAGMVFGSYHFARPGDPIAQADYFLRVAAPAAGEITVLDLEDTAIPDAAAWSAAWCARVKAATGKPPLIYLNSWFLAHFDWTPVLALDCGLWLAKYDNTPDGGPLGPWPFFAVKQFTDHGTIPGQPGEVDRNASPLTLDQLRAYAIGAPAPTPEPIPPVDPEEQDIMAAKDDIIAAVGAAAAKPAIYTVSTSEGIWCLMPGELYFHGSPTVVSAWDKAGAQRIAVPDDQHAALKARYAAS